MRSVAQKFLTHREVSAQEAVYRLLSLPLTQGTRQVVFIDTDLPEHRTRLFKPMKLLENLDEDDPDVFLLGMLDRYPNRPNSLENMCLNEFVSLYKMASKPSTSEIRSTENDLEADDTSKHITLKNNMGYMVQRKTSAIVRYHQWSSKKQPEQFYHSQLLLYYPWRKETADLLCDSYKDSYVDKVEITKCNRDKFEHFSEEVGDVLEDIEKFGVPEESWEVVAPEYEKEQKEEEQEGIELENSVFNAFDSSAQQTAAAKDTRSTLYHYEVSTEHMSTSEWIQFILSLNATQYSLHQFIVDWATKMTLSRRIPRPDPFYLFLTGGAGVGKSHLVRAIVQTVNRIFSINSQAGETHVLVCAPTGAAAFNVCGHTCHAAFLLPCHKNLTDDYIPLSSEKLAVMKDTFAHIKLIVIDEISMVGADTLLTIHRRLCDIRSNSLPFGGISILAVGDLLQLAPVGQRTVFSDPSDEMSSIYGSLWKVHFKILELTEIQRQKNDSRFAEVLNRVRIGKQTDEDIALLRERQKLPISETYPHEATHIFAYNKDVDTHNDKMLQALSATIFEFPAKDSKRDNQTKRVSATALEKQGKKAGGLSDRLKVGIGARVILCKNLDVPDGLVNSAAGIVTGFVPEPEDNGKDFEPRFILVKFDDERVGRRRREEHKSILPNTFRDSTPIPCIELPVAIGRSSKVTAKRSQFPLSQAWALTIHKEQGKTENELVLSTNGRFHAGQFYTAISRTKTLEGLFIIGNVDQSKIKVNQRSLDEIERMKLSSPFLPSIPLSLEKLMSDFLKVNFLNVNSLIPHFESLMKDHFIQQSHITSLAETWLIPSDNEPEIPSFNSLRLDNVNSQRKHRRAGLLTYIHHCFYVVKQLTVKDVPMDFQMTIVSPAVDKEVRFVILTVYNHPKTSVKNFLYGMEKLLSIIPSNLKAIVVGDFNIDIFNRNKTTEKILHLFRYYGFCQLCTSPTHKKGGLIDHFYTNIHSEDVILSPVAVYYSDHQLLSAAIPFKCLL